MCMVVVTDYTNTGRGSNMLSMTKTRTDEKLT